jgi:hypothetical protein
MRRFLSLKLAVALLLVGVALIAVAGWSLSRTIQPGPGEVVVHVPRKFWPGSKPAPEMDEVVRRLRPGETIKIKLVFADANNDLSTPQSIDIRRGSLTVHSRVGRFRLDDRKRVFAAVDGTPEIDLEASNTDSNGRSYPNPSVWISPRAAGVTNSPLAVDLALKVQPLESHAEKGQFIAYVTLEKSTDFDGNVTGWRSSRGK